MSFFDRLKSECAAEWTAYTRHPFTRAMADGSLPQSAFRHYLVQDYLFLIEFARAYALAIYKSPTLADMRQSAAAMSAILDVEMDLHVALCGQWGLTPTDLQRAPPARELLAYTSFVLDTGMRGDLLTLKVALSPCVIGYAEIAAELATHAPIPGAANPYRQWIAEYSGDAYRQVAADARNQLDRLAASYVTEARARDLVEVFRKATILEAAFWQMGLDAAKSGT